MIKNFAKFSCVLNIVEVSISSLSFVCEGCHDCRFYVSTVMRFTRLGALQGDVIWKWITYFQRQSYITVILVVHDSNVSQTTYDLRLVNIKSSSRLEKDITFISRPHLALSLSKAV